MAADPLQESIDAAIRGELRWFCDRCRRLLPVRGNPQLHSRMCGACVAVQPKSVRPDDRAAFPRDGGLPPGWYLVTIQKEDDGMPIAAFGPFSTPPEGVDPTPAQA